VAAKSQPLIVVQSAQEDHWNGTLEQLLAMLQRRSSVEIHLPIFKH